jgi:hypothetical protein
MRERSTPEEGVDVVPLRGALGCLILSSVPWVTSWFPSILVGDNMEGLSELHRTVWTILTCTPSCLHVLGPTCQVEEDPLIGWRVFWKVGPTYRGWLRPWSVGTQGYPCLSSPRSTCRCSGRDEVISKQSEGMTPLRSRRVHGIKNAKPLQHAHELERRAHGIEVQKVEVKARRRSWRTADLTWIRWSRVDHTTFRKVAMPTVGRLSRGVVEAGF